jgi:hypothetical protein
LNKEIRDHAGMLKIIDLLFGRLPVYIIDNQREYPVKIVKLSPKGLVVINNRNIAGKERVLTLVHNQVKFFAVFSYLGGDNKGVEILHPICIRLKEANREKNRLSLDGKEYRLKITNTINQLEIHKAQGFDDTKVEKVIQEFAARLKEKFTNVFIYFAPRLDNRLRLMTNYDKPIYIPDRKVASSVSFMHFPYDEYVRLINVNKLPDKIISEISVAIKYKGYTPLGYVQILSDTPLPQLSFEAIQKVAEKISDEVINTKVFQESSEICEVKDLSATGLSFLHPQSKFFARTFGLGETILFDLIYPNGKKGSYRAVIKNIKNTEVMFRVGVQFYNLTNQDYQLIENFLQSEQEEAASKEEGQAILPAE